MKLKDGLILRQIADQYIIVPVGERTKDVKNMIYISSSAAFLFKRMKDTEFTVSDLTDWIMDEYINVTREIAERDINKFIRVLKDNNILMDEEDSNCGS